MRAEHHDGVRLRGDARRQAAMDLIALHRAQEGSSHERGLVA